MGRRKSIARRIGAAGMLMMIVGGGLLASAVSASATSGTITLSPGPSTGYTTGQAVTVAISGMSPSAQVYVYECSLAPGQPTVLVQGQSLPVSCTVPVAAGKTNGAGKLKAPLSTTVQSGVTGPPGPGVDTAGNQGAADAANYPCPQFVGQTGGCAFLAFDDEGGVATPLPFTFASSVPVPTTTIPSTTTTTAPCIPAPNTVSSGGLTVTVSPATCVKNGTAVTVTGSGFNPGATGSVSECSLAPGQPTISLAGNALDVSCSNPIPYLATVSPAGTMSLAFTVVEGTVGPPLSGKDSAGNQSSVDAEKYPCPSDVTTGVGCDIGFGDSLTQNLTVPITFVPNSVSTSGSTGGGSGASTSASGGASSGGSSSNVSTKASSKATATSSKSLAFTGAGDGLRRAGIVGSLLFVLGVLMLALARQPRVIRSSVAGRFEVRPGVDEFPIRATGSADGVVETNRNRTRVRLTEGQLKEDTVVPHG